MGNGMSGLSEPARCGSGRSVLCEWDDLLRSGAAVTGGGGFVAPVTASGPLRAAPSRRTEGYGSGGQWTMRPQPQPVILTVGTVTTAGHA
jgi:hypothetical protein